MKPTIKLEITHTGEDYIKVERNGVEYEVGGRQADILRNILELAGDLITGY